MKNIFIYFGLLLMINLSYSQLDKQLEMAELSFSKKDFNKASLLFSELINSEPKMVEYVYYRRAMCLYYLKEYKKAKNDLLSSLKINSKSDEYKYIMGESNLLLGRIYSKKGKNRKSLKYYLKATKFAEHENLYTNIGYQLIVLRRYSESIKYLDKAIDLDNKNSYALNNRGLAYIKLKKYNKAKSDIDLSININPNNPYAFKHRALLFIETKNIEKVCINLDKAKNLGYSEFGNESNSNEVSNLINKYCK